MNHRNKLSFLFLLFFLIQGNTTAFASNNDTLKVLFIGNSFMSVNNLPSLFQELAHGAGHPVVVASRMPGGCSVGDTIQGNFAHMYSPEVYALIRSNDWDYLFLQDRQSRFCMGYGNFPGDSRVIEGHLKIRDSLLYYHPCAHVLWFAGFGLKNGYPPYANTGEALIDSIYRNYLFLHDSAGQVLVPIGPSYLRILSDHPEIELWLTDNEHPSLNGSSLMANLLFTTVFKENPQKSTYNPGIPALFDSILKATAYQTSIDSLMFTGLQTITPEIIQTGNQLSVSGFDSCQWFLNGVSYQSWNCTVTISQSGYYSAVVQDSYGCSYRTLEYYVDLLSVVEEPGAVSNCIQLFPNPATSCITIQLPKAALSLEIYNITGRQLYSCNHPSEETTLSLFNYSSGLYLVKCNFADNSSGTYKFIKR